MNTDDNNQEGGAQPQEGAVEGNEVETIAVPKAEYDKLNQTIGSMKRELKDLKKPKEETPPKETINQPDDVRLGEKAFLRAAGITTEKEIDLVRSLSKKWNTPIDQLVDDEDFKGKLDKLRTQTANELATSNVKGGGGKSEAKNTLEYWTAKGTPPSPTDIPDRKTRQAIVAKMVQSNRSKPIKFYNE